MDPETITIETDTTSAEQAATLAAIGIETGLALSDEIKAQTTELKEWLSQQLSTSQESMQNLSTSLQTQDSQLQTILSLITEISTNQVAMAESLLSIQSQGNESATPLETESILIVDPETATEISENSTQENLPESEGGGQRDSSSDHAPQKRRRVQPL